MTVELTPEERFELFGDFDLERHGEEARERWGDGERFADSQRRVGGYSADDWRRITAEAAEIEAGFAQALATGSPSDGDRAVDLAERHRAHISRYFYECSTEVHRALGEMYVADPRFRAHYEKVAEGLAKFVRDAILANAARAR